MPDRSTAPGQPPRRRPLGALAIANLAFVAANVVHALDHMRQGTGRLTSEVVVGGTTITVLAFATLFFTLRRHPRAPLLAALVGLSGALGIAASHLAPHWSAFSDPYPDLGLDALSWTIMLAEIVAALAYGLIGLREMRRAHSGGSVGEPAVASAGLRR